MYRLPRGTADILPSEQAYWRYIEKQAVALCQRYGYERIDTPIFEEAGLFIRSIGEETDIVEKEMYIFQDRGGKRLTLKPEGTASVCRAYLEHGLTNLPQPVRLYYFSPIFRYERPQAGRYRQHHQFGYEAIGSIDPALDAEVIDMAWRLYAELGLRGLSLQLNSIGCRQCRPGYLERIRSYYASRLASVCQDCQVRFQRNPLRLLDCKEDSCQPIADAAPQSGDHLCADCAQHFHLLKRYLNALELPFQVNHRLVRGLDYYTRTVFEVQPADDEASDIPTGRQGTIGGGGRYDDLIEELGGHPTPAVGFATGMERIVLNLKRQGVAPPPPKSPYVFLVALGQPAKDVALTLLAELRRASVTALIAYDDRSLKAQLRQANASGAHYAVVIGEEELKTDTAILRDLTMGAQNRILIGDVVPLLSGTPFEPPEE